MIAGAVIHQDTIRTLHLGHTLSSDPPTAGLMLLSLLKVKLLDLVGILWAGPISTLYSAGSMHSPLSRLFSTQ